MPSLSLGLNYIRSRTFYLNGKRHRHDGPAWEFSPNEAVRREWYLEGQFMKEEDFKKAERKLSGLCTLCGQDKNNKSTPLTDLLKNYKKFTICGECWQPVYKND